jgi:hypothetical protein
MGKSFFASFFQKKKTLAFAFSGSQAGGTKRKTFGRWGLVSSSAEIFLAFFQKGRGCRLFHQNGGSG